MDKFEKAEERAENRTAAGRKIHKMAGSHAEEEKMENKTAAGRKIHKMMKRRARRGRRG